MYETMHSNTAHNNKKILKNQVSIKNRWISKLGNVYTKEFCKAGRMKNCLHSSLWMNHYNMVNTKQCIEPQKENVTREYVPYDSIYIKLKNKQNK
jgi:hypothetical protein